MKNIRFKIHWSFIVLGIFLFLTNKYISFFCYFSAVLLHEFGHYFVAKKLGYQLNIITLMPYGASLSGKSKTIKPKHEFLIAIAGPLVNVYLIIICVLVKTYLLQNIPLLNTFLFANISTLFFNILPVFPLDGGRICLSILSGKISRNKAYKIVSIFGFVICFLFVLMFILSYFYSLNYMLGINSLFLLITLFEENESFFYTKIKDVSNISCLTDKFKLYKISENETVIDTFKLIDKSCFYKIEILDCNNCVKKTIEKQDFIKILFESKYNKTLKQAFCE